MRRVRRVRPWRGRGPHDVLRPAGAAAPRPGKRGHCRGRWRDDGGGEGFGLGHAGVRRSNAGGARGLRGRRPRALLHERRRGLVGSGPAAHLRHRRRADRACPQRHAREHECLARAAGGRGRAAARRHRQRGGCEAHRPGHADKPSPARGHPPRDAGHRRGLCHGAGQPRFALRVPRPQRHPAAVHRRAARRPRLGGVLRDVRARHRGGHVRARREAGRDRALQRRRPARRTRRPCRPPCVVHLRVRLLRPSRQHHRRAERLPGPPQPGPHPRAGGSRGGRPRAGRARLGRAAGARLRARERHPVRGRHREEPLRGTHVHRAHAGHAPAGHPPEAEPAAVGHRRQADRRHRRQHRAGQHVEEARADAARCGRDGSAPAHREPRGRMALFLRHRHRHARPADRRQQGP